LRKAAISHNAPYADRAGGIQTEIAELEAVAKAARVALVKLLNVRFAPRSGR
jgi:hypothetical protein